MSKYNYDNLVEVVASTVSGWVESIGDCDTPAGVEETAAIVRQCKGLLAALGEFDELYRVGRG